MINRRLYDLILRHQMYLDGYKNHQVKEWQKSLPGLIKDLRAEFNLVPYDLLDDMTKREFKDFKTKVAKVVAYTFTFWQNELMKELEEFSKVESKVEKTILANHIIDPEDVSDKEKIVTNENKVEEILDANTITDKDTKHILWLFLLNDIMASTGLTLKQSIEKLSFDAVRRIEIEINKAFANGLTMKELQAVILGTSELRFKDGVIKTIDRDVSAIVPTVIQSISATTQESYMSQFFKKWQWKAILDSRTCEICGYLHNKIFAYGTGPIVPAHRKCRCSKVPYLGPLPDEESASHWVMEQPEKLRRDFQESLNLTLKQFEGKITSILTR